MNEHQLVEDHFGGRTSARADRRLWQHLPACAPCRSRYRALSLLEALEPDATARARDRMGRALFAPRIPRRAIFGGLGLAAAAAIVLLVVRPRDEFRARGGAPAALAPRPALAIARLVPGGGAERVGSVIHADDSLAFSYVNPPEVGAAYLMIFAADEAGHLYWFWPAWTSAAEDARSIAIRSDTTPVELAEAVRHQLPPGKLTVTALFSRQPHRVREVEAAAAQHTLDAVEGVRVVETLQVLP